MNNDRDLPPVLSVKGLTTEIEIDRKPHKVVDDLSFDLFPGKTLALVGESGCGKSMTALSLLKILPTPPALPPKGQVLFQGQNLLKLPEKALRAIRGKEIAMIFQDPIGALNPVYTVGYQLFESVKTHLHLSHSAAEARVIEALLDVQLPNPSAIMDKYPHEMSGGMLQRAMIALALVCSPKVLIADEPTTALDVTIQAEILSLLKSLMDKRKMALLLITHDMGVVAEIADEVIVMYATEKVEEADVNTLFDFPAHPYTQALFSARVNHRIDQKSFGAIGGNVPPVHSLPSGCHFHPRCSYALEVCRQTKVPSFSLPMPKHHTKCWLYDKNLEEKLTDEEKRIVTP